MFILGNLYNKDNDSMCIVVLSSTKLFDYKYCKKTNVIDDVVIYRYIIKISDKNNHIQIGNKTIYIPNVKPQLNNTSVYFVSCDGQNMLGKSNPIQIYNVSDDTDMWKKLYIDIKSDTNIHKYVIHLGDQVYMDDAHNELIKNGATTNEDTMRRIYYNVYNTSYNNKYKKKVLKSAYNVMIGDDHEYINNFRSVPNNLTTEMLSNTTRMYKIFQEDLYGKDHHNIKHLVFNDFQIIIPDLRKYRQLVTDTTTKYPIMGQTQMTEFNNIVKNTSLQIKRTYYVSTTPLVGVKSLIPWFSCMEGDDYIQSEFRLNERKYIMNKLFTLNNVVVIGGDYHYAEYYIYDNYNGKEIKQITTSPISSTPPIVSTKNSLFLFDKIIFYIFVKPFYDITIDNIAIDKKWAVFDYNYLKITDKKSMLCCYDEDNSKTIMM